jgi:hypothetical protein
MWTEDAIAAACFLALIAFTLPKLSPEPVRKPVTAAPAALVAHHEAPLLLPLQCSARVRQSDGRELPRVRLLYAAELSNARCYIASYDK